MSSTVLARIHPSLPRDQQVFLDLGLVFRRERGWYEVSSELAERLRRERLDPYSPTSPLLFEVVDQESAEAIEEAEKKIATPRGTPDKPAAPTAIGPVAIVAPPVVEAEPPRLSEPKPAEGRGRRGARGEAPQGDG